METRMNNQGLIKWETFASFAIVLRFLIDFRWCTSLLAHIVAWCQLKLLYACQRIFETYAVYEVNGIGKNF